VGNLNLTSLTFIIITIMAAGSAFVGCGGRTDETSGSGFSGDETYVPFDRGGGGVVNGDLPVYANPKDDRPATVLRKGAFAYLAAAYGATTGVRRIYYGERVNNGEPEVGWVKDVTAARFKLYCYTVSEDADVYKNPGDESGRVTTLGLGENLVVYHEAKKTGGTTWVKVVKSEITGWVRLEDVAYGDVAFAENAYTYSNKGKTKNVVECLKKAEMSGAFVDYSNPKGPWVARVPGAFFRVFGGGRDLELNIGGGGPVAVGPHGRYLAYTTDEDGINRLHIIDLNLSQTIFESDYVDDFKWSPLGQFLAYREGMDGIYSLQFFSTERRTAIASARLAGDYAWSPDGYLLGFTGARENESVDFYVAPSDGLPDDNLLTTVEVYDPFGLLGDLILESDAGKRYEFAGWMSGSVLNVRVTKGEVNTDGALHYTGKRSLKTVSFDRSQLRAGGHRYWKELETKLNKERKGNTEETSEETPGESEGKTEKKVDVNE
jgi:hypothetical protein